MTYVPKSTKLILEAKQQLHNDVVQHFFIISYNIQYTHILDELTSYISTCNNYKDFASKCLFRDVNDILDLADLTYRYDWYCVDCEAKGLEATINPEVVVERHRALNWIISDDSWDKVEINA